MEPDVHLRGDRGVGGIEADGDEGLRAFYAESYQRLVSVVGAVAQDRHEAEEAVQDAFVRLLGQWPRVSAYEDPEAWVRKVAFGFLSNRRRKTVRGWRALARHGAPADASPPSGDRVDLRRALAALPLPQRQAVVLQDLGLGVEDIARELGVPAGTVKSRLSRARAALIPVLREDIADHV